MEEIVEPEGKAGTVIDELAPVVLLLGIATVVVLVYVAGTTPGVIDDVPLNVTQPQDDTSTPALTDGAGLTVTVTVCGVPRQLLGVEVGVTV